MYQQQNMQNGQVQMLMPEEDMAYTVLADLKRVVREYATAATESSCPEIRGMFTHLLNNTLHMQGELFNAMKQANMYSVSSPALRQDLTKQLQQNQQTLVKTEQHLQKLQQSQSSQQMQQPSGQHQAYQQQQQMPQQNGQYYM
ncbi:spore coat protein [Paenibacillus sepulcri]|uniref:Spore coat protein n=1 Tax=Paenibacillus sepulcri TaxID=359917 RepID=A0ABS7C154_9BACL|nr:spore coat protein [Paenibacillus sepulcri]